VPCGLNYIHRHRFRSQVLIEFGQPIVIGEKWLRDYEQDEQQTVKQLTEYLADTLKPEMQAFRREVEDYESHLEMLGLKDYQLRSPVTLGFAFRKIILRSLTMLALLPAAIPGAMVHLPVGWVAATVGERFSYEKDDVATLATVGERFSYEKDDVATLKVLATILLLPVIYLTIAIVVGMYFGIGWAVIAMIVLPFSFVASVWLIEAEAGLLMSILSLFRLARLGREVEDLRATRANLVNQVRALADRLADPTVPRMFTADDFGKPVDR
jgi:glycerol-3-phosphate O-acyltransferase/dihydroxyacetone phosphate acyltransferase